MKLTVFLSGEIHTSWREDVESACLKKGLDVVFLAPVTDHAASDDCGVHIMGGENDKFWHDHNGAKLNAIRTRTAIARSDIVVVRVYAQYNEWNAEFDAGYASALGNALIIMHGVSHQHALKEVDGAALAVVETADQVAAILNYVSDGAL